MAAASYFARDREGGPHRTAALRHEQAAANHDRAAVFWDRQGKPKQAGLQRDLAAYERHGAELERQWAEATDTGPPQSRGRSSDLAHSQTKKNAEQLASELTRMAGELEKTAAIAEEHARRRQRAGDAEDAAEERAAADRAYEYARQARSQAEGWLRIARGGPSSRPPTARSGGS